MSKSKTSGRGSRTAIAIMAAGKGTRLKSKYPKVLHEVGGKPLLAHVIAAAKAVVPASDIYAIIGHGATQVREIVDPTGINVVLQSEQRGTGHALMVAREALVNYDTVVVLSGDAPRISSATITNLLDFHTSHKAAMTLLSARLENPTGYGRVIRKDENGAEVKAIVEEKAASLAERQIQEINSGFYAFDVKLLFANIDKLAADNPHHEFYLTDMASIFNQQKLRVIVTETGDASEILGGNTRAELMEIDLEIRKAKAQSLMADGVSIFYPESCVIDADVEVAADTVIEPFVQLLGKTRIGSNCRVRSYSVIQNSEVGNGVTVRPRVRARWGDGEEWSCARPVFSLASG